MDPQTKIMQEASQKRDALVAVYLRLERLPKEELPLPKTPVATVSALLEMLAFTKAKAEDGDLEA
eukprot:5175960-Amphidinium_carterae.1